MRRYFSIHIFYFNNFNFKIYLFKKLTIINLLMNTILTPDKNNLLFKNYHHSSKMLIPLFLTSYVSNKYECNYLIKPLFALNVINFGFHSYVSTSCIISDYIKPKHLSKGSRVLNLGFHSLAIISYLKNI